MKRVSLLRAFLALGAATLATAFVPARAQADSQPTPSGTGLDPTAVLLTGFSSKEVCSCAFVADASDEYCTAFGQFGGFPITLAIDHKAKTVTSSFGSFSRTSRFAEGAGCTLDGLGL